MQSSSPLQQNFQQMLNSINQIVLDKPEVVKLSVACLLANGHLLLQDVTGHCQSFGFGF